MISPAGARTKTLVDASTAGLKKSDDEEDGCMLKLRKLSIMTSFDSRYFCFTADSCQNNVR
jgi:hypothetical protein